MGLQAQLQRIASNVVRNYVYPSASLGESTSRLIFHYRYKRNWSSVQWLSKFLRKPPRLHSIRGSLTTCITSPRASRSAELFFASMVPSSRRTTASSAEDGRLSGASEALVSVSFFISSASLANLSLVSLGNWSWSSRKRRSNATEGTSRGTPLPFSAILRGSGARHVQMSESWKPPRTPISDSRLTWGLYILHVLVVTVPMSVYSNLAPDDQHAF